MTDMFQYARNYVELPAPPVHTGGILAAARVVDSTDPHDLLGAEYVTDACADVNQWGAIDPCQTEMGETDKEFDEAPEVVVGDPFTLYAGVQCTLQTLEEGARRAQARFGYGERAAVDNAMSAILATTAETLPGGPLPLPEAVGALENHLALRYGGPPTLVIPLPLIGCACLHGLVQRNLDGSLSTCSGSPVANIAVGITADMNNIYATGQITLLRGALSVISVPQQPKGDGTYEPPRALAERTYVPLIECLAVTVEATCTMP